ncbi:MAG: DUF4091 domain-containing protein [bacterium]|nr:DUF4091 domain-containing protein [bacterium]
MKRTLIIISFIFFVLLTVFPVISSTQSRRIHIKEMERVSYNIFQNKGDGLRVQGFQLIDGRYSRLPIGSTLDPDRGIFSWLPGPGFVGEYEFLFKSAELREERKVRIVITPKFGDMHSSKGRMNLSGVSAAGEPFGSFATPISGTTVSSSIAVTGWALDDSGIANVKIYRGETDNLVYIGDATLVEGARPDIAAAYPGYPNNTRAGWGYMMLTHFLPNGGNGTFKLHAVATGADGGSKNLGAKTITVDNANAVKPFGAIDTPTQGGQASGSGFINWGWVLTPRPNNIPTNGSTIDIWVDGVNIGHPTYNIYRSDIASMFPNYANSSGAVGYFNLDTTAYSDGVHTIQWNAKDSAGNSDGIGSRYFTVKNNVTTAPVTYWTALATAKIRPGDAHGTSKTVHIKAAKNEYESFQIAVSDTQAIRVNSISVSSLTGSSGSIDRSNIKVYRECYMNIQTVSNREGERGLWPDALLPAVDSFFNETRNAFPVTVSANRNQAFWFDVFVPSGASAGEYEGNVTVNIQGKSAFNIPVKLTVWDFTLPSTSTLVSAFGFDAWDSLMAHFGNQDNEAMDMLTPLSMLYAESGLMNRVTLESAIGEDWSIVPWPVTGPIDWTEFDKNWSSFFSGKDLAYGLKNARLTSQSLPLWGDNDSENVAYLKNFIAHFKAKGWYSILFDYTWDEPGDPEEFVGIKSRAAMIRQADPAMRLLVTTSVTSGEANGITGSVDIWTPVINEMNDKTGNVCWESEYAGSQRALYSPYVANGNELWWYQSCMSHGCGTGDSASLCFTRWPSYAIDIPAMANRTMEWMSFKYDVSGELYYAVTYAYFGVSGNDDPWNNQYYFWGNGDGTLFYPGRPNKIGGTHHIPVESIRLKMIREGMEDYEYMTLLKNLGEESFARSLVNSVVTNAYTFSYDPADLYSAREAMAKRIEERN